MRFSGRVDSSSCTSKPNSPSVAKAKSRQPMTSSCTCSSVQKMWASSCAKCRTRSRPCSVPRRLVAVQQAGLRVADRQLAVGVALGRERCAWPGQFIGLTAISRSSALVRNMFSRYLPQWPEVFHSSAVEDLRRLDLRVAVPLAHLAAERDQLVEHARAVRQPEGGAGRDGREAEQVRARRRACGGRAPSPPRGAPGARPAPPSRRRRCRRCA